MYRPRTRDDSPDNDHVHDVPPSPGTRRSRGRGRDETDDPPEPSYSRFARAGPNGDTGKGSAKPSRRDDDRGPSYAEYGPDVPGSFPRDSSPPLRPPPQIRGENGIPLRPGRHQQRRPASESTRRHFGPFRGAVSPPPRILGVTTYRYRALDPSRKELRLLRLIPEGSSSSRLNCEIIHTTLDNPIAEYIAVSYAWGDRLDTAALYVKDRRDGSVNELPVTLSLWQALDRLRSPTRDVLIWADAVCIHQANTAERNHQVGMMTAIYRNAARVAVWLGPESNNSGEAIKLLQDIAQAGESLSSPVSAPYSPNSSVTGSANGSASGRNDAVTALIMDKRRRRQWNALVELFDRDYWRRLWVMQEVFNAHDCRVYCGREPSIEMKIYLAASDQLNNHADYLVRAFSQEVLKSRHGNFNYVDFLRSGGPAMLADLLRLRDERGGFVDDLILCLEMCASRLCAQPVDKLYGVLGMLPEKARSELSVDYRKSMRDVYTDIVDYLYATTGRLDVICHAANCGHLNENLSLLPTWVPDWSSLGRWRSPLTNLSRTLFSADADRPASGRLFSHQRRHLTLSAIVVGHVIRTGTSIKDDNLHPQSELIAALEWFDMLYVHYEASGNRLQDVDYEAFCRTLTLDRARSGWSPSEWMGSLLCALDVLLASHLPILGVPSPLARQVERLVRRRQEMREIDMTATVAMHTFEDFVRPAFRGRKFAIMSTGCYAMVCDDASIDDIVCVALGCSTPLVLRKVTAGTETETAQYRLMGDCFLDGGYMYGRAVEEWEAGEREMEELVVV